MGEEEVYHQAVEEGFNIDQKGTEEEEIRTSQESETINEEMGKDDIGQKKMGEKETGETTDGAKEMRKADGCLSGDRMRESDSSQSTRCFSYENLE